MKILLINKFLYPKGGDATSALTTGDLLKSKGHEVVFWGMKSEKDPPYPYREFFIDEVDLNLNNGIKQKIKIACNLLYSFEAKTKIERLIWCIGKPDIVHLHSFAHQISPSILHVFKKYKIPVVMTMHDYKLTCASYYMLSRGRICELCKGQKYYNCFLQACVRDSRMKSLLNTIEMYLHQEVLHIYDSVGVFIAPSRFLKAKFEEMGFRGKIIHLPYFLNLDEFYPCYDWEENSIVYFGRLAPEKGLFTLIEAMKGLPEITLKIIGEGPLREGLEFGVRSSGLKNVKFLGYKSGDELKEEIRKSMFIVLPSEWYENYPFAIIEGFALGKLAVGAKIGGIPELVKDDLTGLTFEPSNSSDLEAKIRKLLIRKDRIMEMGREARKRVEKENCPDIYYDKLMDVYQSIMGK